MHRSASDAKLLTCRMHLTRPAVCSQMTCKNVMVIIIIMVVNGVCVFVRARACVFVCANVFIVFCFNHPRRQAARSTPSLMSRCPRRKRLLLYFLLFVKDTTFIIHI